MSDGAAGLCQAEGQAVLPICANGDEIGDEHGFWQDVVVDLQDHALVEIIEAIWPPCQARWAAAEAEAAAEAGHRRMWPMAGSLLCDDS